MLNQEELKQYLEYREGVLYWKRKSSAASRILVGAKAGSLSGTGRLQTIFKGKSYLNHRLIYLYHYGDIPTYIDHIDRNPLNNRIENLRPSTRSQNGINANLRTDNISSLKGISFFKKTGKFRAQIKFEGRKFHLGYYFTKEEAAKAYNQAATQYFGEFAKLNEV